MATKTPSGPGSGPTIAVPASIHPLSGPANAPAFSLGTTMHGAFGEIGVELLAVMVLVVLAGTSRRGGTIALTITTSLWIVAAIIHYQGRTTG